MESEMEITCIADISWNHKVWKFSHPTSLESHYTYDSKTDRYTFSDHGKIVRWGKVPLRKLMEKGVNFKDLEDLGKWIHDTVSKRIDKTKSK